MKKAILVMTVLTVAAAGINTAQASAINHASANERQCAPVYYSAPAPRQGRYYSPPPSVVYHAPAPVVGYQAPRSRYYNPAPVVNYRSGYGGEHRHSRHNRW